MTQSSTSAAAPDSPTPPRRKPYVKAVGPKLRKLLFLVFGLVAVLVANSAYLASITFLEWLDGRVYQDFFYLLMFLGHVVLGLLLVVPFLVFGIIHLLNTRQRKNRRAVRVGYVLLLTSIAVLVTGLLLLRIAGVFDLKHPAARSTVYWLHVICPLVVGWLYWLHRLAGPKIHWKLAGVYASFVGVVVAGMVALHAQDPRQWNVVGPKEGEKYFFPSLARTSDGNFIPDRALMNDQYCKKCHADAHAGWSDSVHRFSSFNNLAYLASISETREVALKRDGSVQASRWCAGCHDPVPFFSGAFDDPAFDLVNDNTAHAGITCTVCHAITHVNSVKGNADYTIEAPQHYPFAYSKNAVLQWVNNQLVKAKPSFHKKTFLKPHHKEAEFCSVCHKVHLPRELNHYKDFLRGQNHYDPYLLSGVSGHGARSFYYPLQAKENCSVCHMPLEPSDDFGAKLYDGTLSIHNHLFPSANTAIASLRNKPGVVKAHQEFLDGVMRVDIFGLKEGGTIDGELHAPLRPEVPVLKPGGQYLLDTVIRTVKMGHLFTQGTADSNEVWLDVTVTSGDRILGRSGGMDEKREVDRWAHFVNAFVLDKDGNRINRRNAQDIVVALYNHQIPPGAGQTVHYALNLPDDLDAPVAVDVKLMYRKFDQEYMNYVARRVKALAKSPEARERLKPLGYDQLMDWLDESPDGPKNRLPVTVLAEDRVVFPVEGVEDPVTNPDREILSWQRWNDYGIGLFLKGKAELRQAEEAFRHVEELGRYDGPLNLARVYQREGRVDDVVDAIRRASQHSDPAPPPWTIAWLSGLANRDQTRLAEAESNFRSVLEDMTPEMRRRGFDFSLDYQVNNLLGLTLFDQANQLRTPSVQDERDHVLRQAIDVFERTLTIDPENVSAHFNLSKLYDRLGDKTKAAEHQALHLRYKPDDNARDRAFPLARQKYPAAKQASEEPVIYNLHRPGAPGLP